MGRIFLPPILPNPLLPLSHSIVHRKLYDLKISIPIPYSRAIII